MIDDDSLGERLFGSHVSQRADQIAGHGDTGVGFDAGKTEVGHVQFRLHCRAVSLRV